MPLYRSIDLLHPEFKQKILIWLAHCVKAGLNIVVIETKRDKIVQEAYYAQGRKSLSEVNELRKKAGLPAITEAENKKQVTWTLDSPHLYGLALDFVPINPITKKADWNDLESFKKAGKIAKDLGLEWGGDWRTPDYPHIEMKNWRRYINA